MSPGGTAFDAGIVFENAFAVVVVVLIGFQESTIGPTDDNLSPQFVHDASPGIASVLESPPDGKLTVAQGNAAIDEVELPGIPLADVSFDGLCALVQDFVSHAGVANSMCAKIRAAERADARGRTNARDRSLSAFINEVEAQTGKRVDPGDAAVLISIATRADELERPTA